MSGAGTIAMARSVACAEASPPVPADTEQSILALVTRTYPHGGSQHERAIRLALRLGWSAALNHRETASA